MVHLAHCGAVMCLWHVVAVVTLANQYNLYLSNNDLKWITYCISFSQCFKYSLWQSWSLDLKLPCQRRQTGIWIPDFFAIFFFPALSLTINHFSKIVKYDSSAFQWHDCLWSSKYVPWSAMETEWALAPGKKVSQGERPWGFYCPFPNYAVADTCFSICSVWVCRQLMIAGGGEVSFSGGTTSKLSLFLEATLPN